MVNWDDLRFFLSAAQEKSLAGAARKLGVKHTTIGRRLTALERSVGTAVVWRGPEGLRLTPIGEALLPLVEEAARAVSAIERAVKEQKSRVRLAVPSGYTQLITPGLASLREAYPSLSLELVSSARPVDLKKGEADLAIRNGPVTDPDLVVRKLGVSGWSLYASEAYLRRHVAPIDIDDLRGHDLIGYDASLSTVPAAQWVEERAKGANIVLRSREMTDMLSAAQGGIGLAVLPCALGDDAPGLKRLTDKVVATRKISLVYRREARLSEEVRAVIAYVIRVMKPLESKIGGIR